MQGLGRRGRAGAAASVRAVMGMHKGLVVHDP